MAEAKKPKLQEHKNNPFIEELIKSESIFPRKISHKANKDVWDAENGSMHKMKVITGDFDYDWKDDRKYKKVFDGYAKKVSQLSSTANKMFFFVLEKLPIDRDTVIIKPKEFLEYSGFNARAQYYTAIRELDEAKILAKSEAQGMFYINPCVFFNGRVSKLMPDAQVKYFELAAAEKTRKRNRIDKVEEPEIPYTKQE